VLASIRADDNLRAIPVVVLSSADSQQDVLRSYELHANCHITKPVIFKDFVEIINRVSSFWFSVVVLPARQVPAA